MPRIPLSHAQAGQTLARPVTNAGGMILMQPGTELTPVLIERLGHAGIQSVVIADADGVGEPSPDEVQHAFDELFTGHELDAWMMELKGVVVRQALRGDRDA